MSVRRAGRGAGAALAAATLLAAGPGCGADRRDHDEDVRPAEVHVLAAASLSEVLVDIAAEHEREHPSDDVILTTGGSSSLARQVADGAPADVLVTADEATMRAAGPRAGEARAIAANRLVILTPTGGADAVPVDGIADLADPRVRVALCAPEVPCGRLARTALARAGVEVTATTRERDAKGVVAKVAFGEVDAGIAYATDAAAAGAPGGAGAVTVVDLPGSDDPDLRARYLAAPVDAPSPAAQRFLDRLSSPEALAAFERAGFLAP